MNKKPEILSPAGDWKCLRTAVASGADAVYFGVKGINMRDGAVNFDIFEIKKVVDFLHENNKKAYLVLNVIAFDKEIQRIEKILDQAKEAQIDAVILWDMGVFLMAKEKGLKIHLSTQASVSNKKAVNFYSSLGVKRFVLARECNLDDISDIINERNKNKGDYKIECFVHGAMCVSISGRCFLSEYSYNKSANRGQCIQPCRRQFLIKDLQEDSEYVVGKDYILSPKDLCTIEFIDKLIEAGIDSFKIEGRVRSPEYVKVVTSCYRKAVDLYFQEALDEKAKEELLDELRKVYNRGFSTGFYFGDPSLDRSKKLENQYEKIFVGFVRKFYKKINVADVLVQNHELNVGDEILVVGNSTPAFFTKVEQMQIEHNAIDKVKPSTAVGIKFPKPAKRKDKVFIWRKRR